MFNKKNQLNSRQSDYKKALGFERLAGNKKPAKVAKQINNLQTNSLYKL